MSALQKYLIGEWNWKRPFKSIAFIYISLFIFSCTFANKMIFQPPPVTYRANDPHVITIKQADNKQLALYYLPATKGMPTLLWSHGNAESIGQLRPLLQTFNHLGYGILAYDYPGYGISDGKPTEKGCFDAVESTWTYLTTTLNIPAKQIILYGQSIGSGPACYLAEKHICAGIVLISPLTSVFRTVTIIPLFPGDIFKNINRIKNIHAPLLLIHGDRDAVVKQRNGKQLYDRHPGPKTFISLHDVGHNDIYELAGDQVFRALATFKDSLKK